jgi:cytochrome P450
MHVENAYNASKVKKVDDSPSKTILQQYLLVKDKYNLDLEDILSLTSDFIMAGVDTTSTVLHFILYELGKNQDIQNRLVEEINSVLGPNEGVTNEKLESLQFLKAVVKESLR